MFSTSPRAVRLQCHSGSTRPSPRQKAAASSEGRLTTTITTKGFLGLRRFFNEFRGAPNRAPRRSAHSFHIHRSAEWDVCKSPGFPSNRVAAGQVDPPAVRITMVCSLFACCLSASEAFLFLSGAVCWVFSNAYTIRKNICWFFRGWCSEKGRSYSTQKAARRLRHSAEALVEEAKILVL